MPLNRAVVIDDLTSFHAGERARNWMTNCCAAGVSLANALAFPISALSTPDRPIFSTAPALPIASSAGAARPAAGAMCASEVERAASCGDAAAASRRQFVRDSMIPPPEAPPPDLPSEDISDLKESSPERSASTRAEMVSGGVTCASSARSRVISPSATSRRTGIRAPPVDSPARRSAANRERSGVTGTLVCSRERLRRARRSDENSRVSARTLTWTRARDSMRSKYPCRDVAKFEVSGRTRIESRPTSRPPGPAIRHPRL